MICTPYQHHTTLLVLHLPPKSLLHRLDALIASPLLPCALVHCNKFARTSYMRLVDDPCPISAADGWIKLFLWGRCCKTKKTHRQGMSLLQALCVCVDLSLSLHSGMRRNYSDIYDSPAARGGGTHTHTEKKTDHTGKGTLCLSSLTGSSTFTTSPESSRHREQSRVFHNLYIPSDEERQEVLQRGLLGRGSLRESVESGGPCLRDPQEEGLRQHEEQGERDQLSQLRHLPAVIRGPVAGVR